MAARAGVPQLRLLRIDLERGAQQARTATAAVDYDRMLRALRRVEHRLGRAA